MKKILFSIIITFVLCSCTKQGTEIKIANIPEASGICYMDNNNFLYVVSDEGTLYKLNTKGDILDSKYIGKYDLEGINCNENLELLVEEGKVLSFSIKNIDFIKEFDISKKVVKKYFDKNSGAEGISFSNGFYYISTQGKTNLLKFKLSEDSKDKLILEDKIKFQYKDLSGLDFHNDRLYIISDLNDLIYLYNISTNKIEKTIKLSKKHWEGITIDNKGVIYLADDDGGIYKKILNEL